MLVYAALCLELCEHNCWSLLYVCWIPWVVSWITVGCKLNFAMIHLALTHIFWRTMVYVIFLCWKKKGRGVMHLFPSIHLFSRHCPGAAHYLFTKGRYCCLPGPCTIQCLSMVIEERLFISMGRVRIKKWTWRDPAYQSKAPHISLLALCVCSVNLETVSVEITRIIVGFGHLEIALLEVPLERVKNSRRHLATHMPESQKDWTHKTRKYIVEQRYS